jgi:phosphatidylethanolamine/phosphatidyl-N-methylethanolamine N-methyltransferase
MHQRWADYRIFWQQFRRAYHTTGAVLPSGKALAAALATFVRDNGGPASAGGRRILEVGPGTGAVTGRIIRDMRATDELTLVERNEGFVARLHELAAKDPLYQNVGERLKIVHASVEDLPDDRPFDVIISGLPLNNFTPDVVNGILTKLRRLLTSNGTLSFFEYVAIRRFKSAVSRPADRARVQGIARVLGEVLRKNEIRKDCVWANVPPAWVHHVRFSP